MSHIYLKLEQQKTTVYKKFIKFNIEEIRNKLPEYLKLKFRKDTEENLLVEDWGVLTDEQLEIIDQIQNNIITDDELAERMKSKEFLRDVCHLVALEEKEGFFKVPVENDIYVIHDVYSKNDAYAAGSYISAKLMKEDELEIGGGDSIASLFKDADVSNKFTEEELDYMRTKGVLNYVKNKMKSTPVSLA